MSSSRKASVVINWGMARCGVRVRSMILYILILYDTRVESLTAMYNHLIRGMIAKNTLKIIS